MSYTCFIFPVDTKHWENPDDTTEKPKSDLRIDRQQFYVELKKRFPYLSKESVKGESDLNNQHEEGVGVWISTVEGYETAYIKPYGVNLCEFVLWYREFVPEKYRLYFNCFSRSFDALELTSATTIGDIQKFLGR